MTSHSANNPIFPIRISREAKAPIPTPVILISCLQELNGSPTNILSTRIENTEQRMKF